MRHLAWSVCVLLVALTASAQEGSASLVLEVRAQRISKAELEQALRTELDRGPASEVPPGQLELSDAASNVVRLTFRDAAGHESTRDLYLAPDDPEALEKVTIAAANLVRDQAAALLAELEAQRLAGAAPAVAAPVVAAPVVAAPAPAAAPKPPAYDPCLPAREIAFGADIVPGVGTSSGAAARASARRFSLGLFGTYSAGVHGFELSTFVNIGRRGACGVQLAIANASFGPVHGAQLGVVNLDVGWLDGAQIGVANFVRADGRGVQVGVANALAGRLSHGAQIGVGNFAQKGVHGAQVGVVNLAFWDTSTQIGAVNIARHENRTQLGAVDLALGNTRTQLGVVAIATRDSTAQLSVVNVTGGKAKAQLGVINYAKESVASIGLLNIVPHGHTSLDALGSENGTLLAGVTHGGDYVRNTYAVGARIKNGVENVLALGLGVRLWTHRRVNLDLDLLHELFVGYESFDIHAQADRLKLSVTVWVHERVGLLASGGYALMYSDRTDVTPEAPFGESLFNSPKSDGTGALYGFPSLNLGLRVMLSDPKRPTR
jgi:hypothetical protein